MYNFFLKLTALMGSLGVSTQFYFTLMRKLSEGHSVLYAINHFYSYFTIITNTALAVFLISLGWFPNSRMSRWFNRKSVVGGFALYIAIVGIIYYALLYNPNKPFSGEIIATHILHGYMPPAFLLLWFLVFRKHNLKYIQAIQWLVYPALYFAYVLLRGSFLNKYPYFFLDVEKYGYEKVLVNASGVLMIFLIIGSVIVYIDNRIKPSLLGSRSD